MYSWGLVLLCFFGALWIGRNEPQKSHEIELSDLIDTLDQIDAQEESFKI